MTTATESNVTTTQIHRVYIKASPQAIWDAITKPEWTDRYGYGGRAEFDAQLRPGSPYRLLTSQAMRDMGAGDVAVDGEIVESDPPRRLVLTWRMAMDSGLAAEGFTRLTYEIEESMGGSCKLTVMHDLSSAPRLAELVAGGGDEVRGGAGGWPWVLSDLKSLLETGSSFIHG